MAPSEDTSAEGPSEDSAPGPSNPPTPSQSSNKPNAQESPAATPSAGSDFDLDKEFAKLAAELDDIPGFRNLQPLPDPDRALAGESGPRDWAMSDDTDADGEFVPPDPEVRFDGDPVRIVGWSLVVLGVAIVVVTIILHQFLPPKVFGVGIIVGLVGATMLFWRLPRDKDDEWDNGARV